MQNTNSRGRRLETISEYVNDQSENAKKVALKALNLLLRFQGRTYEKIVCDGSGDLILQSKRRQAPQPTAREVCATNRANIHAAGEQSATQQTAIISARHERYTKRCDTRDEAAAASRANAATLRAQEEPRANATALWADEEARANAAALRAEEESGANAKALRAGESRVEEDAQANAAALRAEEEARSNDNFYDFDIGGSRFNEEENGQEELIFPASAYDPIEVHTQSKEANNRQEQQQADVEAVTETNLPERGVGIQQQVEEGGNAEEQQADVEAVRETNLPERGASIPPLQPSDANNRQEKQQADVEAVTETNLPERGVGIHQVEEGGNGEEQQADVEAVRETNLPERGASIPPLQPSDDSDVATEDPAIEEWKKRLAKQKRKINDIKNKFVVAKNKTYGRGLENAISNIVLVQLLFEDLPTDTYPMDKDRLETLYDSAMESLKREQFLHSSLFASALANLMSGNLMDGFSVVVEKGVGGRDLVKFKKDSVIWMPNSKEVDYFKRILPIEERLRDTIVSQKPHANDNQ